MNQILFASTVMFFAHPFHGTIAEAEWKPKTKTLEVALWVQPIDLEQTLRGRAKKPIDLDETPKVVDPLIKKYLAESFVIRDEKGKTHKLDWVGKEVRIKEVWLYFEVKLPNGLDGATFENRLFFESAKDQVNTINFREGKRRKSFNFTLSKPSRKFEWATE